MLSLSAISVEDGYDYYEGGCYDSEQCSPEHDHGRDGRESSDSSEFMEGVVTKAPAMFMGCMC